jgi:predicted metal-dependent peptidase
VSKMSKTMKADEVMGKAVKWVTLRQPFFATLLLRCKLVVTDRVETCALLPTTSELLINPEFIVALNTNPLWVVFVLLHEVMHLAFRHPWRRGKRNIRIWNIACDYAVNALLREAGFPPPTGRYAPLLDPRFYGMSAEQIYAELVHHCQGSNPTRPPDTESGEGETPSGGIGGIQREAGPASPPLQSATKGVGSSNNVKEKEQEWDDHTSWEQAASDPACAHEVEALWRGRLAEAVRIAKQAGKLPVGLERIAEEGLAPRVDWRAVLAALLTPTRSEYVWRPDRRMWPDVFVPDLGGELLEDAVIAVDTSASVSPRELGQFLTEVRAILQSYPEVQVYFAACDAAVHTWKVIRVAEGEPWPDIELRGGGGTDFRPVFRKVEECGLHPRALLYLTDGYGTYPETKPRYPVVWVLTPSHHRPPWGQIVVLL